jgi:hypothetical protein
MYHRISPVHTLIESIATDLGSSKWYYNEQYGIGYITLPNGVAAVFVGIVNGVPSMDATIVDMPKEDSAHVE